VPPSKITGSPIYFQVCFQNLHDLYLELSVSLGEMIGLSVILYISKEMAGRNELLPVDDSQDAFSSAIQCRPHAWVHPFLDEVKLLFICEGCVLVADGAGAAWL
jgi:hypothetical protein